MLLPIMAVMATLWVRWIWRQAASLRTRSTSGEGAFAFEPEDVRALTYIPLRFRMKLDVAGIHLTQRQWNRLPRPVRQRLIAAPYQSDQEISGLRNAVVAAVREVDGGDVRILEARDLPWRADDVPAEVLQGLSWADLPTIDSKTWRAMSEERRFALVKLTRRGHSKNLEAALREFGLLVAERRHG